MKRTLFFPAFFLPLCAVPALSDRGVAPRAGEIAIRECVEMALCGNFDISVPRPEQEGASHGVPLEVEVRKTALSLAEKLLDETAARIEAGLAAPMDRLPEVTAKTDAHVPETRLWRSVGTILDKEGTSIR